MLRVRHAAGHSRVFLPMAARLARLTSHLTGGSTPAACNLPATPAHAAGTCVAGSPSSPDVLDFGWSFIAGEGPLCAIRFVVESKCTLYDDRNSTVKVFYQCASCKSEDTFGAGTARSVCDPQALSLFAGFLHQKNCSCNNAAILP